jgi:hypothetical protein
VQFQRYGHITVHDKGKRFNTNLLEAVELGFLLAYKESCGGYAREDYPNRDDVDFMRHTMAYKHGTGLSAGIRLEYKPVAQTRHAVHALLMRYARFWRRSSVSGDARSVFHQPADVARPLARRSPTFGRSASLARRPVRPR